MVEYALLLALIAMVVSGSAAVLGNGLGGVFNNANGRLTGAPAEPADGGGGDNNGWGDGEGGGQGHND